jgi:hypothetical protein
VDDEIVVLPPHFIAAFWVCVGDSLFEEADVLAEHSVVLDEMEL